MSKARDLANLISQGNPLSDGAISVAEISDLTASAAELNKLDGVTASTAELNHLVGATSSVQTQLDNISVTSGSLTKTFTQNETADITLSQSITSAPVVSATKEVPQTGVSTKGNWDVNSTASNYDFHNTAANVTLTPSTVGYGLSSLTSDNKEFSYGSQDNYAQKVAFSTDGTKFYLTGNSPRYIYQYNLSTAWDVSTASYSNNYITFAVSYDISTLAFKTDGTKMYVGEYGQDYIYEYNLSTAWDISTASYTSGDRAWIGGSATGPMGMWFKPDGTQFFVGDSGTNGAIISFTLSTAWDITSLNAITHSSGSLNLGGTYRQVQLTSDGTKMYVLCDDSSAEKIAEFSLSTAWDVTTASRTNADFDYSNAVSTNVPGFYIKQDDGTKLYVLNNGASPSKIMQFSISQSSLVLGSGSFASTDVGKRIVGNGGDVILTSTGGAFSTTGGSAFTDNSTIAAGSWSMFGLKSAGDTDGITMSGVSSITPINLANGSYDNKSASTSSQSNSEDGVFFKPDGTRMYVLSSGGSTNQVDQYNLSTAWDVSTASYASVAISISNTSNAGGIFFKPDGTKMYLADRATQQLDEYTLSTAWDLSTTSYTRNIGISNFTANAMGVFFKPDGTKVYIGDANADRVREANLTTAWDITTISYRDFYDISSQETTLHDIEFTSDGTKMFVVGRDSDKIHQYDLSTAWDVTTASYNSVFLDVSSQGAQPNGMHLKADDGTKFYVVNSSTNAVYQYSSGASQNFSQPTSQYHVAVTNSGGRIDSQYFTDINSMTAAESAGTGTAHYAVSTDGRTTWSVAKGTDGVRPIVRNNSGTWQYNNDATYGSTTWADGSTNDELYTLQQALSVAANRMDKTQLDAVADANHFSTGNSLDLMIALRMDTAASTLPTSDGVTLNYDAAALNEGAVLGTDYDFFFPANNKVQIKSLAAQNLKVRVV